MANPQILILLCIPWKVEKTFPEGIYMWRSAEGAGGDPELCWSWNEAPRPALGPIRVHRG